MGIWRPLFLYAGRTFYERGLFFAAFSSLGKRRDRAGERRAALFIGQASLDAAAGGAGPGVPAHTSLCVIPLIVGVIPPWIGVPARTPLGVIYALSKRRAAAKRRKHIYRIYMPFPKETAQKINSNK